MVLGGAAIFVRAWTHIKGNYQGLRRATGDVNVLIPAHGVANTHNPDVGTGPQKIEPMCMVVVCHTTPKNYLDEYGHFPPLFMPIEAGISTQTACGLGRPPFSGASFLCF
jgi:hypothetical protein